MGSSVWLFNIQFICVCFIRRYWSLWDRLHTVFFIYQNKTEAKDLFTYSCRLLTTIYTTIRNQSAACAVFNLFEQTFAFIAKRVNTSRLLNQKVFKVWDLKVRRIETFMKLKWTF